MKITILDEKDIMEAISKLTEFVRSQYPDATVNGNMTVYVSLDGEREITEEILLYIRMEVFHLQKGRRPGSGRKYLMSIRKSGRATRKTSNIT